MRTKTEATTPEVNMSEAFASIDLTDDQAESQDDETTETETDTTEDTEAAEADEVPTEDESEETDGDEDDLALPALDETIRSALGDNAEAVKLWERQWKGITKRETKLRESEAAFAESEGHYNSLQTWEQAFNDPAKAPHVIAALVKQANKDYGLNLSLAGLTEAKAETPTEFEYESDALVHKRAVEDAQAAVLKTLGVSPDDLKELMADRAKTKAETEFQAKVDREFARVSAKVQKLTGWAPTKEAVASAMRSDVYSQNELAAIKRADPDGWADHRAAQERKKTFPEMVAGGSAKGLDIPKDPDEYGLRHAFQELNT
jgi:hypothetical protein